MTRRIEDFIKEARIIKEITAPQNKLIMVIGGADTGKTTFVECIADFLAKQTNVGIVDLDMGQSHIGVPTTIAWGKIKGKFKNWTSIIQEDFYFTGTLTPYGSLLQAAVGAKLITDKALSSCRKVVIDTTGLIAEPAGRILKQLKVDLLSPDIIIALERSKELGHIHDAFKFQTFPKVHRIPVLAQVKSKSPAVRTRFRAERLRSYFTNSNRVEVSLKAIGVRFTGEPMRLSTAELKNRIVSFRDKENRDIAVGLIERAQLKDERLLIHSPINKDVKFSTLVIGTAKITL